MIYREDGWIARVEVISQEPTESAPAQPNGGVKTTLKVIEHIRPAAFVSMEDLPKVGETFTVWKSNNNGGYPGGWHLGEY